MIATITTKRFRLAFETGDADTDEGEEESLPSNTGGDFDPAPDTEILQGDAQFGFTNGHWRAPRGGGYQLATARREPTKSPTGRAGTSTVVKERVDG